MCGIVGATGHGSVELAEAISRSCGVIAHRGPDAQGVWCAPGGAVVLANRRLAILDLRHEADQPMERDGLVLTHNGEIYNFVELATELRSLGHSFTTTSDTEVILRAYQQWGTACVERFNGMFAFALWDGPKQTLFVARDRFGEKPLYYAQVDGRFVFASEIKALLTLPGVSREPDAAVLHRFLLSGAVADGTPATFFRRVRQLPAAHTMEIVGGVPSAPRPYWSLVPGAVRPMAVDEATAEIGRLLRDSVRIRLRSDVPVGSSLSGGIDSSLIVALVRELETKRQFTFTATYDDVAIDESQHARLVVERLGVDLRETRVSARDLEEDVDRFVWHQDEPVPHTSQFAQWKVMQLARANGVTVLLDGQGADEVFGGYHPPAFGGRWLDLLVRGRGVELTREVMSYARLHRRGAATVARYLALAAIPAAQKDRLRARAWRASRLVRSPDSETFRRREEVKGPYRDRFRALQAAALTQTSLPSLLRYGDRNSMAFSIESRLPFLDHRLVEFVYTLPSQHLNARGWSKVPLRALLRPVLPEIAERRDKIGFATPERAWFTGPLLPWIDAVVARARGRELFLPAAVDGVRADVLSGRAPTEVLWRIIHSELWLEQFVDRDPGVTA